MLDLRCPLAYKGVMQTVVETPSYLAIANKLFSEEDRADIVSLVAVDPESGDVMGGTGGFRKVRVAREGMGKSVGALALFTSGAMRGFLSSSSRSFRRTRKPIFPRQRETSLRNAQTEFLTHTGRDKP